MHRPVRPEDFALYNMISEPSFSPDGGRIAISVRRANLEEDVYDSEVLVVDSATGRAVKFTSGGRDSDPVWSPDGKSILFTSKRGFAKDERGSALYVIPSAGGEAKLLVKSEEGIENPQWAPDSRSIFYLSNSVRTEKDDVKVIRRLGYWYNGKGFTYNKRRHIFRFGLDEGKATQLTRGEFEVVDSVVSNDGRRVAYLSASNDVKPYISDLIVLDLKNGRRRKLTRSNMSLATLAWSPDDRSIAVVGHDMRSGISSHGLVWKVKVQSGKLERIDRVDANKANGLNSDVRSKAHGPHKVLWRREGVYYLQADGGAVGLYRLRPGSRPVAVVTGQRSVEGFDVSSTGVAFVAMSSSRLEELYLLSGRERRLTKLNSSVERTLDIRPSTPFRFVASDGETIEGWVMKPAKKGRVPAILYVHGGPKTAFGSAYMHEFQTFAAAGYAVVFMNPRGSDGYSERFADIRGAYGTRDYDDLMEGLDRVLRDHPEIDGKRLGVAGGSYGGYMTNWVVGHTSRFRAAVTDRSIANWVSMWGVSDIGPYFTTDQMAADPWDGEEKLMSDSPLRYARNVTTPLLVVHSMEDYRCPIPEGIQFFTALKVLGKKAEMVVFPGENHDLSRVGKPKHRLSRLNHYVRWFDSHLK